MVAFNKYNSFAVNLAKGAFDFQTAGSQLKIALSNTTPLPGTHTQLSQTSHITPYTNITETMPADTTNVGAESPAGTWDVSGTNITLNATGNVAQFQYVILYDELATNDELLGWWDHGTPVDMTSGDSYTITFGSSIFTIT
jgi:hypothetical protein